ncbi:chaperone NapD [Salipiger sp. PrR002]|uniref:chaperone NapD n=1 Tax=Salipiger sp. PrR002 TaxID=2706489 RepID=UPI0013BCC861|nr:chaperone NapD [Salipiger sp. PrR002]NDW00217.1 chaperone NapD [Salipiger sp. PrR002]NDW56774.1 chaperone NapD [Salipiger sp. PrR004]
MNICGCLVHVAQDALLDARAQMEALDGVEVHAQSDDGRLVVVVEDTDTAFASDTIMSLHQIRGVISLTINYHHFEDLPQRPSPAAPHPET